jgi:hypothetical protein
MIAFRGVGIASGTMQYEIKRPLCKTMDSLHESHHVARGDAHDARVWYRSPFKPPRCVDDNRPRSTGCQPGEVLPPDLIVWAWRLRVEGNARGDLLTYEPVQLLGYRSPGGHRRATERRWLS